jgi:type III secretory pathway component EscU
VKKNNIAGRTTYIIASITSAVATPALHTAVPIVLAVVVAVVVAGVYTGGVHVLTLAEVIAVLLSMTTL